MEPNNFVRLDIRLGADGVRTHIKDVRTQFFSTIVVTCKLLSQISDVNNLQFKPLMMT